MAITRLNYGSSFTNLVKSDSFLDGNSAYVPSSFESIATVTASGSETSLTFSSIPNTYKALQIRGLFRQTANTGTSQLWLQYNGNTSGYARHMLYGEGSGAFANSATAQSAILIANLTADATSNSNIFSTTIIDIQDYASTSKNKTVRGFFGTDVNGATSASVGLSSGFVADTNALTSITLFQYSSNAFSAGSKFALYGIKG